ncbi:MAG: STAS-like domain-containing protein [Rikenellaceae bacterium]
MEIRVLTDFSEYPGPRYIAQGKSSGEMFYYEKLNPSFAESVKSGDKLTVVLDGTAGYASSFLDEAFGNLVYDFTLDVVKKHIGIISNDEPHWIDMISNKTFNEWEDRRKIKDLVVVSDVKSIPWARIIEGNIVVQLWQDDKLIYQKTE